MYYVSSALLLHLASESYTDIHSTPFCLRVSQGIPESARPIRRRRWHHLFVCSRIGPCHAMRGYQPLPLMGSLQSHHRPLEVISLARSSIVDIRQPTVSTKMKAQLTVRNYVCDYYIFVHNTNASSPTIDHTNVRDRTDAACRSKQQRSGTVPRIGLLHLLLLHFPPPRPAA